MEIKYIGHACFSITSESGLKIVTDPYEAGFRGLINYGEVNETADIVTVSHEHGDHSHTQAVSGNPVIVRGEGTTKAKGLDFRGIACYHDSKKGAERGTNTIFTFEVDGIRLAHLGDLGHPLSSGQLAELKGTEILLAPTGGPGATLELEEVVELWEKLQPRVVIPMHFKTDKCAFPKYGVEDIIRLRPGARQEGSSSISFIKGQLPKPVQIVILKPSR